MNHLNLKLLFIVYSLLIFSIYFTHPCFAEDKEPEQTSKEKKMNVMVSPLGLLIGALGAEFNFGVSEKITLGLGGDWFHITNHSLSANGGGAHLRMNYFLSGPRFGDSWYVSPKVTSEHVSVEGVGVKGASFAGLIGYSWLYQSGFNMNLAGGIAYSTIKVSSLNGVDIGRISGTHGTFEFNLGYAW